MAILGFILPVLPISQELSSENLFLKSSYFIDSYNDIALIKEKGSQKSIISSLWKDYYIPEILLAAWLTFFIKNISQLIRSLTGIFKKIKKAEKLEIKPFTIIKSETEETAFSFFNFIFLNNKIGDLTQTQQDQIVEHEKIHARKLHSLDNIFFSVVVAIFWFNPLTKRVFSAIREIHEFSVDSELTGGKIKKDYSRLIVHLSAGNKIFGVGSRFSDGEIRNRIILLANPESENLRKRRFIFTIPVVLVLVFAFYFVSASINFQINKNNTAETEVILFEKNTFELISPYFENIKKGSDIVSHREVTYSLTSFSPIFAAGEGVITKIDTFDNWGVKELNIYQLISENEFYIYKSVYQATVNRNQRIKKGDKIGISGDKRLYPSVSFKWVRNNKAINPIGIIEKN